MTGYPEPRPAAPVEDRMRRLAAAHAPDAAAARGRTGGAGHV